MRKMEEVKGFLIKNVTLSLSKGYHVMVRQAHHDKKIGSGLAITQILSRFSFIAIVAIANQEIGVPGVFPRCSPSLSPSRQGREAL
mgnify:CR=1 FL=1